MNSVTINCKKYISKFENRSSKFQVNELVNDELYNNMNLLLKKHTHYLSDDLYDGYESDISYEDLSFRIGDKTIFKSIYRSITDENIIKKLIKWIKYLPYKDHNLIMLELIFGVFKNYGDHLKKIIDSKYVYLKLEDPLKRILWYSLENWINEYIDKTYFSVDRFNSVLYDTLNFITTNNKLFLFNFPKT